MGLTTFDVVYTILSVFTAFFFMSAFFIALDSMRKGLTYETLAATLWGLGVVVIARIWHLAFVTLDLAVLWHKWPEIIEYILYFIAYAIFLVLLWRGYKVRMPKR